MKFLRGVRATGTVEWVVTAVAVVAVVATLILSLANTSATEGGKTRTWVDGIPDP
ncbi:MAG: hypothetical protein J7575_02380 [Chloroflexi bacterium]|nr:hypothetical protein [Chloroflexota bacterium]